MFATQEKQQLILIGPLRILVVSALIVEIIDQTKYNMNIVKNTSVFSFRNTTAEKRKKKIKQLFVAAGISEDFYNEEGERFLDEVVNINKDEFICNILEKRKEEEKTEK